MMSAMMSTDKVITEISNGGQITVKLGRKVYDDPNNPYGVDFIVYGNSFFSASGGGAIKDSTDLDIATLSSGFYGHPTLVSVSQDGTNWFTFTNNGALYPDNAYRWDATNHAWTDEQLNPTKPLNPSIYGMNFGGTSGIGLATALCLAEHGARVGIIGRNEARVTAAATALTAAGSPLTARAFSTA